MPNKTLKTPIANLPIQPASAEPMPLTPEAQKKVMDAIATIQEAFPFLIDLTADQRRKLLRMGDGSRGFVSKASELIRQNPDFLPRYMNAEQMSQTAALWAQMEGFLFAINQLQELMEDTHVALGSQVYRDSLKIYQYAKSVNHTGTLEQIVDEMGKRFNRKGGKKKPAAPGDEVGETGSIQE
jgi:hypothetical protein